MIQNVRIALSLMAPEDRRRLARLIPVMVLASSSDILTVVVASTFFQFLTASPGEPAAMFGLGQTLSPKALGLVVAATIFVLIVGSNLVSTYATYRLNQFGYGQITRLSETVFSSILRNDYPWFLGQNSATLRQQTLGETTRVVQAMIVSTVQLVARTIGALAIIGYLLLQDPVLTLALGVSLSLFYYGLFRVIRGRAKSYGRLRYKSDKERQGAVMESLRGVKELKVYGLERTALARLHKPNQPLAHALTMAATVNSFSKPALEIVAVTGLTLMVSVFVLTDRPLQGVLSLLGTYAIAGYRLLPHVQRFFNWAAKTQVEEMALNVVEELTRGGQLPTGADTVLPLERALVLEQVEFTYPGAEASTLQGIDASIARGSWVALVGTTGAGKTSLVDVMMGLLRPTRGQVRVDDTVLDTPERMRSWQRNIGYVPQSLFMNDASVLRNIAFGEPEPDLERAKTAARMACIADFIETELPEGYQTRIGEQGSRLSGGQRQRLGIARALYRRPDLLVLDEATSALDNRTEAKVVDALREHFAETTVIMIAHRLSTTRYCDQILLIDRGRVLARGSYDELLETSPIFRQMIAASDDDVTSGPGTPGASGSASPEPSAAPDDPAPVPHVAPT